MPGAMYRDTGEILFRANKNEGKARGEKRENKNFTDRSRGRSCSDDNSAETSGGDTVREGNSVRSRESSGISRVRTLFLSLSLSLSLSFSLYLYLLRRALNRSRIKP
jgi:hypothetical protein